MEVAEFLYDRFGKYITPGSKGFDWVTKRFYVSAKGGTSALIGTASPTFLVADAGVWVQTKLGLPAGVVLPEHIHWGAEDVFRRAVREARALGRWYGVMFGYHSPEAYAPLQSLNTPEATSFTFYRKSGETAVEWRPAAAAKIAAVVAGAFPRSCFKASSAFALAWHAAGVKRFAVKKGVPLTRDQERAAKQTYLLFERSAPQALVDNKDLQAGMRLALETAFEEVDHA